MKIRHLLFDLDGTLIDSAPSILECYRLVLCQFSLETKCSLERSLIGPPLAATLRLISGVSDEGILVDMSVAFKKIYDTTGVMQTLPYDGITELLQKLHDAEHNLYIVTNKRIVAARKICDFLGWTKWFEGIYARDAFDPNLISKSSVIERALQIHRISKTDALYFGDRNEDGEAAHANGLKFVWVEWGYGDKASIDNAQYGYETAKSVANLESFSYKQSSLR
jgi:phosphoglycolate phosphatase